MFHETCFLKCWLQWGVRWLKITKVEIQMVSAGFPILTDNTNNQEKFQVPKISLSTAPRFAYASF